MKCPNCGNEMVQSRAGWLCLSCGHIEGKIGTAAAADTTIATGKNAHDQMASAVASHDDSDDDVKPAAVLPEAPPVHEAAEPEPQAEGESDDQPESSPDDETKPDEPKEALQDDESQASAVSSGHDSDDKSSEDNAQPPEQTDQPEADPSESPSNEEASPSEAKSEPDAEPDELSGKPEDADAKKADAPADKETDASSSDSQPDKPGAGEPPAAAPEADAAGADLAEVEKAVAQAESATPDTDDKEPQDNKSDLPDTGKPAQSEESNSDTATPSPDAEIAKPSPGPSPQRDAPPDDEASESEHAADGMPGLEVPDHPAAPDQPDDPNKPAAPDQPDDQDKPDEPERPATGSSATSPEPPAGPPAPPSIPQSPAEPAAAPPHSDPTGAPPPGGDSMQPPSTPPAHPPETDAAAPPTQAPPQAAPPQDQAGGKPPLKPETHPKHGKFHLFGMVVLAALATGVAGLAVYATVIAPRTAFAGYLLRLGNARTMAFSASVNSAEAGYQYALKLSGNTDLRQASSPKLAAAVSGDVKAPDAGTGSPVTGQLTANLVSSGKNLYFKLTSLSLRSQVVGLAPSSNWYSLDLASSASASCFAQGTGEGSLLNNSVLSQVHVTGAKLVGFGSVNGSPALHYHGTVDTSKLPTDELSDACRVAAASLKSAHLTYDIWRGWSQDRLELAIATGSQSNPVALMLSTKSYNSPVAINAPVGAEDAANLFTNVLGASTVAPGLAAIAHAAPAAAPESAPTTSADQVRADLAAYLAAYRNSGGAGFFATNPPAVNVNTGHTYTVVTTKATAPGQLYYQAGGACTGPSHVPGRTATRYLALSALAADGSTVCVDSSH